MGSDEIQPDTKDWTWVISQPCPECGFDPTPLSHSDIADHIRCDAADWVARLREPGVADTYTNVPYDAWSRRGLRSNGSEFTVASIAMYHLHDIVHHANDVTPKELPT